MALVYDDDAKGVFAIVLGKKAGKAIVALFVIVQPQRLVGGDVDAGILRTVAAALGADNTGVVTKSSFEFGIGLCAQFVAVAQEQRGFRELPGLAHAPQQIGGDDGFACAGGKRQ